MRDEIQHLEDGTLGFLPERLNRDPTVLRGLTSDEMWVALAVGASCGLLLGIPLALVTSALAMLPTSMIASMLLFTCTLCPCSRKRSRPIW
jgi:conjugative transfer region protein (TIGR03750 family)